MRQLKITTSITNRSDKSLEKYLQDISKEEMISPAEEIKLTRRIREGDDAALERMVKANLRFVVSVSKQYQNGNLGLIKAAKKFDETRGFKFISYAVWWIRQSILEALSDKSRVIRIPLNQVGVLGKINKAYSKLEQDLGRTPTTEEISEEIDIADHKIKETLMTSRNHVSYDAPMGGDDENSSMIDLLSNKDFPSTDSVVIEESLRIDIERTLDTLDPKCREIIKLNYGIGYTHPRSLDEIGEKYSLTRERVRQIKEKGLKKLRAQARTRILKQYL